MAVSLKLVFESGGDKKVSMTFPCAKISASAANVKSLMQEIVGNGDIYAEVPVGLVKAEFAIHTITPIDLS